MSATHTQGPWHWDSDVVKNDPTGRVRYRVCAIGKTVTQVYYSSYEGGLTNAEADARLIAEAPAMKLALALICAGAADLRLEPVVLVGTPGEYACWPVLWIDGEPFVHRGTYTELITAIGWDRCVDALEAARGA